MGLSVVVARRHVLAEEMDDLQQKVDEGCKLLQEKQDEELKVGPH